MLHGSKVLPWLYLSYEYLSPRPWLAEHAWRVSDGGFGRASTQETDRFEARRSRQAQGMISVHVSCTLELSSS